MAKKYIMNDAAFFTVTYPAVDPYFDRFIDSIKRQSVSDFDLVIFNDGMLSLESKLHGFKGCYEIINVDENPVKIREIGLKYLLDKGYTNVVFGDSDDYFSGNRVEDAISKLSFADIVVNEIDLVSQNDFPLERNYLSTRLENGCGITKDFVLDKNVFGLSNTAIKTNRIEPIAFDSDLVALDWFFYSLLLSKGLEAVFTSDSTTFYRQHSSNTVGLRQFDRGKFFDGIKVKKTHYSMLSKSYTQYENLSAHYTKLYEDMLADSSLIDVYYKKSLKNNIVNPLWWEQI